MNSQSLGTRQIFQDFIWYVSSVHKQKSHNQPINHHMNWCQLLPLPFFLIHLPLWCRCQRQCQCHFVVTISWKAMWARMVVKNLPMLPPTWCCKGMNEGRGDDMIYGSFCELSPAAIRLCWSWMLYCLCRSLSLSSSSWNVGRHCGSLDLKTLHVH